MHRIYPTPVLTFSGIRQKTHPPFFVTDSDFTELCKIFELKDSNLPRSMSQAEFTIKNATTIQITIGAMQFQKRVTTDAQVDFIKKAIRTVYPEIAAFLEHEPDNIPTQTRFQSIIQAFLTRITQTSG